VPAAESAVAAKVRSIAERSASEAPAFWSSSGADTGANSVAFAAVPPHVLASNPIAPDALLPGDPGRAMVLAQLLTEKPLMSNHNRGLWGYTGETPEGRALTVQSTGIGAPSAAIVLHELAELGVKRAIRVGTCGAVDRSLKLGELLRVDAALPEDGVSRALGAEGPQPPDPVLGAKLEAAGGGRGVTVATTDLFYEYSGDPRRGWIDAGASAVEMEASALFTLGRRLGVALACLLVVTDVFPGGKRRRIEPVALEAAVEGMGRAAAAALAG
jgi:uridine phosphorylase